MSDQPPPPPSVPRRNRRGVALVMAIVILAALLLLGLPFLSSQSASLAGVRVFSDAQRADIGVDTATRIATAVAVEVVRERFKPVGEEDTQTSASKKTDELAGPAIRFDSKTLAKAWEKAGATKADAPRFVDDQDLRTGDPSAARPPPEVLPAGRFTFIQFDELLPEAFARTTDRNQPTTRANATLIGAVIEDESGKLNPNTMSVAAWDGLLKGVFGTWETGRDATRIHDRRKGELGQLVPKPSTREIDELTTWCELFYDELPDSGNGNVAYSMDWDDDQSIHGKLYLHSDGKWYEHDDYDNFGELAKALAALPARLPGGRITDLDQLLLADTGYWDQTNNGISSKAPSPTRPNRFGLRRPLARAELDRLRPYLSLHAPAPGRNGLIDLGTILVQRQVDWWDVTQCDVPVWADRAMGWGAGFRTAKPHKGILDAPNRQPLAGHIAVEREAYGNALNRGWYYDWGVNGKATHNDAIAIQSQAPVNFFSAARPVLRTLRVNRLDHVTSTPEEGLTALVAKYAAEAEFPYTLFKHVAASRSVLVPYPPVAGSEEAKEVLWPPGHSLAMWNLRDTRANALRILNFDTENQQVKWARDYAISLPPLGWSSAGTVAISSIATTTDSQGRQVASRQRRTIIQAIPHERPVERRWSTQAAMDELVGQVFTSNMLTWPHPVERLAQDASRARSWPDHLTTGTGSTFDPKMPSWRVAPLPNYATGNQYRDHKWPAWRTPAQLVPYKYVKDNPNGANRPPVVFSHGTNGVQDIKDANGLQKYLGRPITPNIDWSVDFGAAAAIGAKPQTTSGTASAATANEDPTWPRPYPTSDKKLGELDVRPRCSAPVPVGTSVAETAQKRIEKLRPDGYLLDGKSPLAYPIVNDDFARTSPKQWSLHTRAQASPNALDTSTPHGVLRRSNRLVLVYQDTTDVYRWNQQPATEYADKNAERSLDLGSRHIGLWIKPETEWTGQPFVTLFEARMPLANATGEIGEDPVTKNAIDPLGTRDDRTRNTQTQNLLSLTCDVAKDLLVLTIAPPTVPHTWDAGPLIPWDDPLTPDIDERSGGLGYGTTPAAGSGPACLAPASWFGDWSAVSFRSSSAGNRQSPLRNVSQLIVPNTFTTVYSLKSTKGSTKHFRKHKWTQVQVVLGSSRPGGVAIIVDGIVGRDVLYGSAVPATTGTGGGGGGGAAGATKAEVKEFGDQCTIGALPLKTAIPLPTSAATPSTGGTANTPSIAWTTQGRDLVLDKIEVQELTIHGTRITAEHIFPARGMVRINDECILYQSVKESTFTGCVRAQRQNTNTGEYAMKDRAAFDALLDRLRASRTKVSGVPQTWPIDDPDEGAKQMRWPRVQKHDAGTLVLPAGYRIDCSRLVTQAQDPTATTLSPTLRQARLYQGGGKLSEPFPSGDPSTAPPQGFDNYTDNPYVFRIWAALPETADGDLVQDLNDPNILILFPGGAGSTIPLDPDLGVKDQFPKTGGIVAIHVLNRLAGEEHARLRYYAYTACTGNALTGVTALDAGWDIRPRPLSSGYLPPTLGQAHVEHRFHKRDLGARAVMLVSIKMDAINGNAAALMDGHHYRCDGVAHPRWSGDAAYDTYHNDFLAQLMDSKTGRIEWITYDHIAQGPSGTYLITMEHGWRMWIGTHHTAVRDQAVPPNTYWIRHVNTQSEPLYYFGGNRGRMRTDFAGRATICQKANLKPPFNKMTSALPANSSFPQDTLVIPVQTECDDRSIGHCLATGDVVTIMPKTFTVGSKQKPVQAVIRYAAMDGYPDKDEGPADLYDVRNEYFAFAHALPDPIDMLGNCEILSGNAWSPSLDLTGTNIAPAPSDPNQNRRRSNAPIRTEDLLAFAMPRLDLLAVNMLLPEPKLVGDQAASTARLVIGSADTDPSRWPGRASIPRPTEMLIDGLYAGAMPTATGHPSMRGTVTNWYDNSGTSITGIKDASLSSLPCLVETRQWLTGEIPEETNPDPNTPNNGTPQQLANPAYPAFDRERMGLIRIGGEIFAYTPYSRPNANGGFDTDHTRVRLVARGLLGSKAVPHVPDEPFLVLPLGPVALLDGTMGEPPLAFRLDDGVSDCTRCKQHCLGMTGFDAPVALISKPDGTEAEVFGMFGTAPEQASCHTNARPRHNRTFHTAGWCRGLYNTPVGSWTGKAQLWNTKASSAASGGGGGGGNQLQPVIIGWWPRYPSAMPSKAPTNAEAMYRCRLYGWMGFPHGMNHAWFWPELFRTMPEKTDQQIASITLLDTGNRSTGGNMDVEVKAMAMARDLDWTKVAGKAVTLSTGVNDSKLDALFEDQDQFGRAVEGAEIRVFWRYTKTPAKTTPTQMFQDLAEAGCVAPALGPAYFRCLAPTRVLAVEGQR